MWSGVCEDVWMIGRAQSVEEDHGRWANGNDLRSVLHPACELPEDLHARVDIVLCFMGTVVSHECTGAPEHFIMHLRQRNLRTELRS